MRRINIHVDEELDAELAAEAARNGESKAALLRRAARAWLDRAAVADPEAAWAAFTGAVIDSGDQRGHDDETIYRM